MTIDLSNYKKVLMDLIERDEPLEEGTILIFEVDGKKLTYSVSNRYFCNLHGFNEEIFDRLKLNKKEFCEMVYGHTPGSGDFPVCRSNWKKNAISIAWELFRRCEGNMTHPKEIPLTGVEKSFLDDVEVEEHNPFAFGTKFAENPFAPEELVNVVVPEPEVAARVEPVGMDQREFDELVNQIVRANRRVQRARPANPIVDDEIPF